MMGDYRIDPASKLFQKFMSTRGRGVSEHSAHPCFPEGNSDQNLSVQMQRVSQRDGSCSQGTQIVDRRPLTPNKSGFPTQEFRGLPPPDQLHGNSSLMIRQAKERPYRPKTTMRTQQSRYPLTHHSSMMEDYIIREDEPIMKHHQSKGEERECNEMTETVERHRQNHQMSVDSQSIQIPLTAEELKKKYDRLSMRYEELKQGTQKERKKQESQLKSMQENIEIAKEKLTELQLKEDDLLMEGKRLKEKLVTEGNMRRKAEEGQKEAQNKIKMLMEATQQNNRDMERRNKEMESAKRVASDLHQQTLLMRAADSQLLSRCQLLEGENSRLKREVGHKQALIEELRRSLSCLTEENNSVKDQLYALTTRLFRSEQQNQVLRADVKRDGSIHTSLINNISAVSVVESQRQNEGMQHSNYIPQTGYQQQGNLQQGSVQPRQRGEFAKERAKMVGRSQESGRKKEENAWGERELRKDRKTLQGELAKIAGAKVMTGNMRRMKMEIERQLMRMEGHPQ